MLIAEALSEIKLIEKKIQSKHEAVMRYLVRDESYRDPLTREGGSSEYVKRELQATDDLEKRRVALRTGINRTNLEAVIEIDSERLTVAEWLSWRREVATARALRLKGIAQTVIQARSQAMQRRVTSATQIIDTKMEIAISVDESWLTKEIQHLDTVVQDLDGKLSLFNATVQVNGI